MPRLTRIIIIVLVVFIVISLRLAFRKKIPPQPTVSPSTPIETQTTILPLTSTPSLIKGEKFNFGIEYVFPGDFHKVASYYSEIGANWAKFNGPGTFWRDIEPKPSVNGAHSYNWDKVDEAVKVVQGAGFLNLTIVVGPRSEWGSKPVPKGEGIWKFIEYAASTPPKDEHWQDFADWVSAFVERYDKDGKDDMSGLKAPILHYEIMTEAQHEGYWRGTVEEYVKVLKTSYQAAKRANPNVKIILSGFAFADLFDEGPLTETQIGDKINKAVARYSSGDCRKKSVGQFKDQLEFNKRILKEKDYFDIVEFHLLSNYTSLEGVVKWIKNEMQKNGYQKPIWAGDAGFAPQIPSHNRLGVLACFSTFNQFSEPWYDDGDKIYEVLTSKKDKYGYSYDEVRKWFYKEQSQYLSKSLIIEMNLGVVGTNIYTWLDGKPKDWMTGALKNWLISGLREGVFEYPKTPEVAEPRPVFFTYKMIIEKLGNFSSVEKLDFGNNKINAYKFMVGKKPIYVLWYDDGIVQKPGEKEVGISVNLSNYIPAEKLKMTSIFIETGKSTPKTEIISANSLFSITESPVFTEEE